MTRCQVSALDGVLVSKRSGRPWACSITNEKMLLQEKELLRRAHLRALAAALRASVDARGQVGSSVCACLHTGVVALLLWLIDKTLFAPLISVAGEPHTDAAMATAVSSAALLSCTAGLCTGAGPGQGGGGGRGQGGGAPGRAAGAAGGVLYCWGRHEGGLGTGEGQGAGGSGSAKMGRQAYVWLCGGWG